MLCVGRRVSECMVRVIWYSVCYCCFKRYVGVSKVTITNQRDIVRFGGDSIMSKQSDPGHAGYAIEISCLELQDWLHSSILDAAQKDTRLES